MVDRFERGGGAERDALFMCAPKEKEKTRFFFLFFFFIIWMRERVRILDVY